MQRRPRFARQFPVLLASAALVLLFVAIVRLGAASPAPAAASAHSRASSSVLEVFERG
jgi:hypothetical protein